MKILCGFICTALVQIHGISDEVARAQLPNNATSTMIYVYVALIKIWGLIKVTLPLALLSGPLARLMKWHVDSEGYVEGVLVIIAIDHLIGTIYHVFKKKDGSFKANISGLILKLTMCTCGGALFETLQANFHKAPLIYDYLKMATRFAVMAYPAVSACMNMSELTNGKFPPLGWIKKFKNVSDTGDLTEFKEK